MASYLKTGGELKENQKEPQASNFSQNVGKSMKISHLEKCVDQLGDHITFAGCSSDPESFRVDF